VHVVDASRDDPERDIAVIDNELHQYVADLASRPQIIAFNKMDVPEAEEGVNELTELAQALGRPYAFISAASRQGTDDLARRAFEMLQRIWEEEPKPLPDAELPVLRPRPSSPQFNIEREGDGYRVTGERPVMLVEMLWRQSDESKSEALKRLRRMGVVQALRRAGAVAGDPVRFGDVEMLWDQE
jgi:GTP-binding protein